MSFLLFADCHKDDSEETMLLKLLRGVHITNIAGLSSVQQCSTKYDDDIDRTRVTKNSKSNDHEESKSSVNMENNSPNSNDEVSMDNCYWVRPLLHVRKQELIQYLQRENVTWRDDGSNQSNKYLRNRIRNELVPLLHDMLQKEDKMADYSINSDSGDAKVTNVLERRLDNLQQQSSNIRHDLDVRVRSFLSENVKYGVFFLPSPPQNVATSTHKHKPPFDIVTKEIGRAHV